MRIRPDRPALFPFIAYLHNSIFPPLLTAAEEEDCLRRLAEGDEEARSQLIEHNLRLVAHICKKFESSGIDKDDLLSIGTIGLIKGIGTFRQDKGARLATYAARCIENEILMHLRSIRNQRTEVSLYDPVGVDKEGNVVTLLDLLSNRGATVSESVELAEEKQLLMDNLHVLNSTERFVICLRYGLGQSPRTTQRQIAAALGISRSYVSRRAYCKRNPKIPAALWSACTRNNKSWRAYCWRQKSRQPFTRIERTSRNADIFY